jgi:hypothetical protein
VQFVIISHIHGTNSNTIHHLSLEGERVYFTVFWCINVLQYHENLEIQLGLGPGNWELNRFSWGDPVAAQFQNWTGVPRPVLSPRQWPGNPTPLLILNMSCQLDLAQEFDVRRSISWYLEVL